MAKPTPLPMGRPDPHINQSRGAENYIMNFYVTNYSTSFVKPDIEFNKGRKSDIPAYSGGSVFKPRSAPEYRDTGFTTNVRPQIYYNRTLDELDNPEMGRMCEENYNTTTQLHFQPYKLNDGTEDLPVQVLDQTSAFTQIKSSHNPRPIEVRNQFIDTKLRSPFDTLPNHRTKLDIINNRDPVRNENHGHGPKYMSTEYQTRFDKPKPKELDKNHSAIGPKEISGFVSNQEKDDAITTVPGERWLYANRPTGITVYKEKFLPYAYVRSETQLPNISNLPGTKDSTYAKTFKPSDINPKDKNPYNPSEYKDNFKNKSKEPSLAEKLGSSVIGPKEQAGQTRCEPGYVQSLDDPKRFITTYQINHFDKVPKGKDREGYVVGGIKGPYEDAYSLSTKVHSTGDLNTSANLFNMNPYQSRSIRARDTFYDDHSHEHKFPIRNNVVTFEDNNLFSLKTSA